MNNYELTERGKVAIAIIFAVLLFVIPAIFFIYHAWNGEPPNYNPQIVAATPDATNQNDVLNSDYPDVLPEHPDEADNNGETNAEVPEDPPHYENDYNGTDDIQAQPEDPSVNGAARINIDEGTMRFWFSPEAQESIDSDVVSLMGDFLQSPQNTASSEIVVEIPSLTDEERESLESVITAAFAEHNVSQNDLSFAPYLLNENVGVFEIRMHFGTSAAVASNLK